MSGAEAPAGRFEYDGLIVDLDGVVWLGGVPIDGAAHAIGVLRSRGVRIVFVTNDPQGSRQEFATRLTAIGVPVTAADVVTSAAATARFMASRRQVFPRGALVVGGPALRAEIERAGLRIVAPSDTRAVDVVVVGGDDGFDYGQLVAATRAVRGGAALYATGRDAVFPTEEGPLPATGAILASIEVAAGTQATVIGKPEPLIFQIARDVLDGCRHVAVVGDHLVSDIAGAKRAGLDAILVLTGTATVDELERAVTKPDLVIPSIAALVSNEPRAATGPDAKDEEAIVGIKRASPEDASGLVSTYEWLFTPPGSRPPTWDPDRAAGALVRAATSEASTVLVAREDERVVGMCTVYLDIESVRFGRRAWVEDLMVDPKRRSRGIGKRLLDAAKSWARDRGATHLELDSAEARVDAHRFYEREGPSTRSICFGWEL